MKLALEKMGRTKKLVLTTHYFGVDAKRDERREEGVGFAIKSDLVIAKRH